MTKTLSKLTLSVAASAVLASSAFALDPAITNFAYRQSCGMGGCGTIIIDLANPTKQKNIAYGGFTPAISANGAWFYANDLVGNNLVKINAYDGQTISTTAVGTSPVVTILSPDETKAYVINNSSNTVSVINTATNNITATIAVGAIPASMILSPDGTKGYITNLGDATVSVINLSTNTITSTITSVAFPLGIAINNDGSKLYVANVITNTISVINTADNSIASTIAGAGSTLLKSADGTKLYVSSWEGTVKVYSTTDNSLIQTVNTGFYNNGLSLSPDGKTLYVNDTFNGDLITINTTTYATSTLASGLPFAATVEPRPMLNFISPNLITGTLETSSSADMTTKGFSNYVNFAGGTLRATGSFTLSNPVYLHDAFNLTYDDSSTFTTVAGGTVDTNGYDVAFDGNISGVGGLTKDGAGVLTLSGTNTYSGGTTITGGLVNFADGANLGTANITLNGGGLQWASGNVTDISARLNAIGADGATFDTNANDVTLASVLSGAGGVTKTGTGVLTLSGTNTYSGGTTITGGLVNFADGANLGTANITLNGGGLQWATGNTTDISARLNAIGANGATFDTNNNDVTLASVLSGTGGITKTNGGILILSGANSYSGGTTVLAGGLQGNSVSLQGNIFSNNTRIEFAQASDGIYAGVMSGTGFFQKTGAGVLTLSGANSYSGGTEVVLGTLKGDTLSLQGDIFNYSIVEFDQATDGTYADIMSETGALNKSGVGVLTLSGTNTYSGATTINAGTLAVTGDTSSSSFTVNSGATLSGSGTVGSTTVTNGAILAPSTTSTLSISGDLVMDAGSTLKVNAYANGTNSKVAATGTATINGGSVNVTADSGGTWNNSTVYTVVSATGGVSGTFASVTDNLAFLDPSLSYESGAVKLTLARNDVSYVDVVVPLPPAPTPPPVVTPTPPPVVVPTPAPEPTPPPVVTPTPEPEPVPMPEPTPTPYTSLSTFQVAKALDNGSVSPNQDMQQLYTALNSMSVEQARTAIAELGGAPLGSISNLTPVQTRTFATNIFSRMSGASAGGIGLASLAFADAGDISTTFKHLADVGAIGENGYQEPQKIGDIELWIRLVGGRTTSSGDASLGIADATTTTGGIQTGIDKKMGEWIVGGSFGYLRSDMEQTGLDGDVDSYQFGLYLSQNAKNYRLSANIIGGQYKNDTARTTPTGSATADYDGLALSAEVKAAYKYPLTKTWTIEPTVGGWIQRYAQDSFTESGAAGSNLSVEKTKPMTQALTTELKFINTFGDSKNDKGIFETAIGYTREFGDVNQALVGRFSAAPTAGSFSIAGAKRGEDVLTAMIGGDIKVASYTRLFTLVNASLRENEESYSVMGGVKIGF